MSDSDSLPGQVEYSDDEDYIRNESVMSARHTKNAEGSILDQQHFVQREKTHEKSEDEREIAEALLPPIEYPQQKDKVQLPIEQSQNVQASQIKAEAAVQMDIPQVSVIKGGKPYQTHSQIEAEVRHPVQDPVQSQSPSVEKAQKQEGVNSEQSNDDEQGYRETYFSEETGARKEKLSELILEQPKQEQINNNATSAPAVVQPYYAQTQTLPAASLAESKPQQQSIKAETKYVIHQKKEHQNKEKQHIVENNEQNTTPMKRQSFEEKPQVESRALPVHYSQSQQDLLAGMEVVAASNDSQLTQQHLQRKLFKTDLQKEEDSVSNPLSSQYVAVERANQKQNSALQELTTMNVPQRKVQPKELSSRKEEKAGPSGQVCKCVIM